MTHGVKSKTATQGDQDMATKTEELPAQAADAATGAAAEVIDAASDPVGTTTKQVRRLERRRGQTQTRSARQRRETPVREAAANTASQARTSARRSTRTAATRTRKPA